MSEYNDKVKIKFLESNISSNANKENIKVLDCFYSEEDKKALSEKIETTPPVIDDAPSEKLLDSIRKEILNIKNENIEILLLRIHSPYDKANKMFSNMNTQKRDKIIDAKKRGIKEFMNHSMKIFLFNSIDDEFHSFI